MEKKPLSWTKFSLISGLILLLLVIVIGFNAYFILGKGGDIAKPSDQALLWHTREVEAEKNGYLLIHQACKAWQETADFKKDFAKYKMESPESFLEIHKKEKVWEKNQKTYQLLQKAFQCEISSYPTDKIAMDSKSLELLRLRKIATMLHMEILIHIEANNYEKAIDLAMDVHQLAHHLDMSSFSLINVMIASVFRDLNYTIWQKLFKVVDWNQVDGHQVLADLRKYSSQIESFQYALKGEYTIVSGAIDSIENGDIGGLGGTKELGQIQLKFLFQPNYTRKLQMDFFKTLIDGCNLEKTERDKRVAAQQQELENFQKSWRNPVGRILLAIAMPNINSVTDRYQTVYAQDLFLQTILAIQLFQQKHKALPENLEKLVPEYLESVPINLWDGLLFSYSKQDRKLSTSVAKNLEYIFESLDK